MAFRHSAREARVAAPFHIIDGYNLLHAAGLGRPTYGPGDLERVRNRLLSHLRTHLAAAERARTTVVFDARDAPPDRPRRFAVEGMTILFAAGSGDADAEIERLIAAHSAPRRIRVVSSDHRLQKAARRRRAVAVDCEAFLARLDRRGPVDDESAVTRRRQDEPKYGGGVSETETNHWLRVFGDALAVRDAIEKPDEPAPADAAPPERRRETKRTADGARTKRGPRRRRRDDVPADQDGGAAPAEEAIGRDEVAFWQARIDELGRESVDPAGPAAENPG